MDGGATALSPRHRLSAALVVLAFHLLAIVALIRAFAPAISQGVARQLAAALTVTVITPTPEPAAPAAVPPHAAREPAGQPGRKATPRAIAAPVPPIVLSAPIAPRVAATGSADTAGASTEGQGTGADDAGNGTGAGGAALAVKLSGEISAARDFPAASREMRLGHFVVIALTVGTDGRVHGCRIVTPSPDAQADRITCRLANDRFRFRPARDRNGHPVESLFGWKQRWYRPGET